MLGTRRREGVPSLTLAGDELITIATEAGMEWSSLGTVFGPPANMTLMDREGSDAELLYLQFPPRVPLAIYATLFGGNLPTLFWTDFGYAVQPGGVQSYGETIRQRDLLNIHYWKALNAAGMSTEKIEKVKEPTGIVMTARAFDGHTYSIRLQPNQIIGIFGHVPRHTILQPTFEMNPELQHKVMTDMGVSQTIYFHSMILIGMLSGNAHDPARISYNALIEAGSR
jgi:hypothetical protein